jgi:hypothetical protein
VHFDQNEDSKLFMAIDGIIIIPNMLEILDQLPDSYLAFGGRLSEITARTVACGIEGAGRM